ncbi:putative zinc-binding metallopeptidase [Rhizobium sp. KVB221]|uniref:Zinc-binding metallopeptidase n=1 Tax=Rhizobium setariae TaxID=2801340 RepID=A0A936YLA0_9HYPH|nr:putative zinc-binding metallopeptidase [Rhizobium setariae]MBL0372524.1 putative zinc-binding metallopeptidase [Rhizobium setariae]
MKLFRCQKCGTAIHFTNDVCLTCGFRLGYICELFTMSALVEEGDRLKALADPGKSYIFCRNANEAACNWLAPTDGGNPYCLACHYNLTIPDLSVAGNLARWQKVEQAKKHLFYSLTRFGLPIPSRRDYPDRGLAFEFLAERHDANGGVRQVQTGHAGGLISVDIAEAGDAEREVRRTSMGEPYRTLIGHFRHEIGHFYWDLLVRDRGGVDAFRAVFGDPEEDYAVALKRHYRNGAPPDWQVTFISAYASAHPWEDFAETWAHCFHMIDGLETAHAYGIKPGLKFQNADAGPIQATGFDPYAATDIEPVIAAWVPLTVAINSVNRSLGQADFYPFVLSEAVIGKIAFVLKLIAGARCQPGAS